MANETKEQCETCKWWKITDQSCNSSGEERSCTRYPPTYNGETGYEGCMIGNYPLTPRFLVACGEYIKINTDSIGGLY